MALDFGTQQRTLCGYHKKDSNKFGLIEKKFPIFQDEEDSVFLLTRDHFFSINTLQIKSLVENFPRYKKFNDIKRIVANIFIAPGILIAIAFILKYIGLLAQIPVIANILETKIISVLFGFSIFNVIILWHDFYKDKSHPIQLPKAEKITSREIDEIKATGFKFGRYAHLNCISFASDETLELICNFTQNKTFKTYDLFKYLIENDFDVQQIGRRSGLEFSLSEMDKDFKINAKSIPDYKLTALRSILTYSLEEALLTESKEVQPQHIFLAIMRLYPETLKYLQTKSIPIDILREISSYGNDVLKNLEKTKFLNPNIPYYSKGGIAGNWVYGYTFILGHFSKDVNEIVSKTQDKFGIGQDDAVENLVSILGKLSNKNALLIGEAGVGKSSIILGIAQRINSGNVPPQLRDKRIIQLDLNGLVAQGMKYGNIEELVMKAMEELRKAGNTILFIDEMQEIIPAKSHSGGSSIAGILLPYILNSKFPIVGTVNYSDYKKYFYSNESLRQSFTNIEVKEVSMSDALDVLKSKIPSLEKNFGCYITFPALVASVELAYRYIKERKLPSSAVQTIEATCAWAQSNGIQKITDEHVAKAISIQKNINIAQVNKEESNKLLKLEENIQKRVIGQDEGVIAITEALRRSRTDVRNPNKPIGVFLFMGPTGVGKTYLAKVVGEEFFGNKTDMIRVDMSEYQDTQSIDKFLGSTEQSNVFGQTNITLVDRIKSNPYTVVLFDEIEKANTQILNLFLQIFDEGRLTSAAGETVDFTNSIIVCTSNIGSQVLLNALEKDASLWEEAKDRALIELRQALKPELLNRFDQIIVFAPLEMNQLSSIAEILLSELSSRMSQKGIAIKWAKQIPMLIANKANEPGMGARPLKRYIQDKIEGQIAKEIIEGNLKSGSEINIKESWIV